jgi:hypothetical protein
MPKLTVGTQRQRDITFTEYFKQSAVKCGPGCNCSMDKRKETRAQLAVFRKGNSPTAGRERKTIQAWFLRMDRACGRPLLPSVSASASTTPASVQPATLRTSISQGLASSSTTTPSSSAPRSLADLGLAMLNEIDQMDKLQKALTNPSAQRNPSTIAAEAARAISLLDELDKLTKLENSSKADPSAGRPDHQRANASTATPTGTRQSAILSPRFRDPRSPFFACNPSTTARRTGSIHTISTTSSSEESIRPLGPGTPAAAVTVPANNGQSSNSKAVPNSTARPVGGHPATATATAIGQKKKSRSLWCFGRAYAGT